MSLRSPKVLLGTGPILGTGSLDHQSRWPILLYSGSSNSWTFEEYSQSTLMVVAPPMSSIYYQTEAQISSITSQETPGVIKSSSLKYLLLMTRHMFLLWIFSERARHAYAGQRIIRLPVSLN